MVYPALSLVIRMYASIISLDNFMHFRGEFLEHTCSSSTNSSFPVGVVTINFMIVVCMGLVCGVKKVLVWANMGCVGLFCFFGVVVWVRLKVAQRGCEGFNLGGFIL